MADIIVAFSRPEDGKNIKGILVRNGFEVAAVCTSGAQAIAACENLDRGILVCGWHFEDMLYSELRHYLPQAFDMLLIASPGRWLESPSDKVVCLSMPLKVHDLINTLEMMAQAQSRYRRKARSGPRERSEEEKKLISQAKALLMERNHMSEAEAHRYIQKCSMDSGTGLVEMSRMIVSMIHV